MCDRVLNTSLKALRQHKNPCLNSPLKKEKVAHHSSETNITLNIKISIIDVFLCLKWLLEGILSHVNQYLLVQSQQWKYQNIVWNLFKVNRKDARMTSLTLLFIWTDFAQYSGVSMVDFEHVNAGWDMIQHFRFLKFAHSCLR